MAACEFGFNAADGVEVDLQRTNDQEVFLFHDNTVPRCGTRNIISIPASTKPEVMSQFKCLFPEDSITMLSELFTLHKQNPDKDVFLDIKSFINVETVLKMPTPQQYLNRFAQDIFGLMDGYELKFKINLESENAVFLNAFKKHYPKVNTWLTSYGDFDVAVNRAFREHYTGISIKNGDYITSETVKKAHQKGLQVCVWTVNDRKRLNELIEMKVDVVQTDSLF